MRTPLVLALALCALPAHAQFSLSRSGSGYSVPAASYLAIQPAASVGGTTCNATDNCLSLGANALPSLASLNATPQGQQTITGASGGSGSNVVLTLSSAANFSMNGIYTVHGTNITALNNDWVVTPTDATHITLQNSTAVSLSGFSAAGTVGYEWPAIGQFDEADKIIIGVNGCVDIYGNSNAECPGSATPHAISLGAATTDRAGIAKVMLYINGNAYTLTSQQWNSKNLDFGYVFVPQSNAYNGSATIYADIYPVNGYVQRTSIPLVLDTSSTATAINRPVFYVDYNSGVNSTACATARGTSGFTWKTVNQALACMDTTSAPILYVNPAYANYNDYYLGSASGSGTPINTYNVTITSGTKVGGLPVASATKWTLTRHQRYSLTNGSPAYQIPIKLTHFDRVAFDTSEFSFTDAANTGRQFIFSNCDIGDQSTNTNGTYPSAGVQWPVNSYPSLSDQFNSQAYRTNSFFLECSMETSNSAGALLKRNITSTNSWDEVYLASSVTADQQAGLNGAIPGYRSFNHHAAHSYTYYDRSFSQHAMEVSAITPDSVNDRFTVIKFADPATHTPYKVGDGALTVTGTTATVSGGSGTFVFGYNDRIGVPDPSSPSGYCWGLVTNVTVGPSAPTATVSVPTCPSVTFNAGTSIPTGTWMVSTVQELVPSVSIQFTDLHFLTGNNSFAIDPLDSATVSIDGFANNLNEYIRHCDFHRYFTTGGINNPLTPANLGAATTATVSGLGVTFSAASTVGPGVLYPGMTFIAGGGSGTVATVDSTTHVTLAGGSTVPNGAYTSANWSADGGSSPMIVVRDDATKSCNNTYTGPGTGNGGGTGAGAGAAVSDQFVAWIREHGDCFQTNSYPSVGGSLQNAYMQGYQCTGTAVQPLFPGQILNVSSMTASSSGWSGGEYTVNFTAPQTFNKYDALTVLPVVSGWSTATVSGLGVTFGTASPEWYPGMSLIVGSSRGVIQTINSSTSITLAAGSTIANGSYTSGQWSLNGGVVPSVVKTAVTNSTSVTLMAPLPFDISVNATAWRSVSMDHFAFVNAILANNQYNGEMVQFQGAAFNWAMIDDTFNVSTPTANNGKSFYFSTLSTNFGVAAFTFLDSVVHDVTNAVNYPLTAGAGVGGGFYGDNNCFVSGTLYGTNATTCSSSTFGTNYAPPVGIPNLVGQITGTATAGPPLVPFYSDGTARSAGDPIGAQHR